MSIMAPKPLKKPLNLQEAYHCTNTKGEKKICIQMQIHTLYLISQVKGQIVFIFTSKADLQAN